MLNIYYADETLDKEKFLFDRMREERREDADIENSCRQAYDPDEYEANTRKADQKISDRKIILIVPDQFSIQAEKDALDHLGTDSLMNFMVTDFSSLGQKVVRASGVMEPELIDKYGRHMLLSDIISEVSDDLTIYRGCEGRSSFTEMTNSLISEMKRYAVTPAELTQDAVDKKTENTYLGYKLRDIGKIYSAYEERISGRYLDSEDYIRFYGKLITQSRITYDSSIWIYGFDTFSPLNIEIIMKLLESAHSVSIVMTCADESLPGISAGITDPSGSGNDDEDNTVKDFIADQLTGGKLDLAEGADRSKGMPDTDISADAKALTSGGGEGLFDVTGYVIRTLAEAAEKYGSTVKISKITGSKYTRDSVWTKEKMNLRLVQTGNVYAEAERLASWITMLIRDKGYRYRDIAVICNDMERTGGIIKRTLEKCGILVFADRKRSVMHQPAVSFLLALCDCIAGSVKTENIMAMVKSGMLGFDIRSSELLENYASEFRINTGGWKKPFTKTGDRYTAEDIGTLNEMREYISNVIKKARDDIGRRNTAGQKVRGLYEFLESDFNIRDHIEITIKDQQELELNEAAAETAQSWNMICGLLEQIIRIEGDQKISNTKLTDMIRSGLEAMEIGLVPTANDVVIIGTMQRTRLSHIRALAVVDACEGLIPMEIDDDGMLTDRELDILEEFKLNITKRREVSHQEEQLAIYRMLSLPGDELYVSCSMSDSAGNSKMPAAMFEKLRELFPETEVAGDLDPAKDICSMLLGKEGTAEYMTAAARAIADGEATDRKWLEVINWYMVNDPASIDRLRSGMAYSNADQMLDKQTADALYTGDTGKLRVSASRLESYSGCPFAHFVDYGLKPDEQRKFEVDARDIGDVYHNCLMEFSKSLTPAGGSLAGGGKAAWMDITEEECRDKVREILRKEESVHREGLFIDDNQGRFRMERIEDICGDVAWALVNQVRHSKINQMYFELPFGSKGSMEMELDDGSKVNINGRIDRLDMIGSENALRIIDYKTGRTNIDLEYIRRGYKLQLMMYLIAAGNMFSKRSECDAAGNADKSDGKYNEMPVAGVFYFKIFDYSEDRSERPASDDSDADIAGAVNKAYKMEGIVNDNKDYIEEMDTELSGVSDAGTSAQSETIPVKFVKKNGCYQPSKGGILLTGNEFRKLAGLAIDNIRRICEEICGGQISPSPKREDKTGSDGKSITACSYCGYKSICMFDTGLGCRYEKI